MTKVRNTGRESVGQIQALEGSYADDLRVEIERREQAQKIRNSRAFDGMSPAAAAGLASEIQEAARELDELRAELRAELNPGEE